MCIFVVQRSEYIKIYENFNNMYICYVELDYIALRNKFGTFFTLYAIILQYLHKIIPRFTRLFCFLLARSKGTLSSRLFYFCQANSNFK